MPKLTFGPTPLIDQLDDSFYATIPGTEKYSKPARERKERIAWLRKKYKDDPQSLALADKLEGCMWGDRCKSAACPECSDAARRLVVKVARPFLKKQTSWGHNRRLRQRRTGRQYQRARPSFAGPAPTKRPMLERDVGSRRHCLVHRRQ